jgi:hypothetical protein
MLLDSLADEKFGWSAVSVVALVVVISVIVESKGQPPSSARLCAPPPPRRPSDSPAVQTNWDVPVGGSHFGWV